MGEGGVRSQQRNKMRKTCQEKKSKRWINNERMSTQEQKKNGLKNTVLYSFGGKRRGWADDGHGSSSSSSNSNSKTARLLAISNGRNRKQPAAPLTFEYV